uniref:Uncharacterized protein n=1 Tax=Scytosiphon lomentaria TaxID=27967 RepID=A0A0U1XFK9_SCYLO|nr:hypothetical protein ScloMp15 [Scytosiphon lomentaria]AIQ78522.1 hypothetical protein ScloMp15 [Scytosiphon lomentaria]
MFTPRKRQLRKKRHFLSQQHTFALFNASNLKTSDITKIKLFLGKGQLYSIPLYLKPPKLGLGYPMIMITYDQIDDLRKNINKISTKIECLGVCINKKWYPTQIFKTGNIINQNEKILSLLLLKKKC